MRSKKPSTTMFSKIAIISLLLAAIIVYSEAAQAVQMAKTGARVEIDVAKGAKAISRTTKAGKAIFNFDGANKGFFVNQSGKKLDSANYELKQGGILVIKKVSEADEGVYAKEPNPAKGNVAGPVLKLEVE